MATTLIVNGSSSFADLKAQLFQADAAITAEITLTKGTNNIGRWVGDVSAVALGLYDVLLISGTTHVGSGVVELTNDANAEVVSRASAYGGSVEGGGGGPSGDEPSPYTVT